MRHWVSCAGYGRGPSIQEGVRSRLKTLARVTLKSNWTLLLLHPVFSLPLLEEDIHPARLLFPFVEDVVQSVLLLGSPGVQVGNAGRPLVGLFDLADEEKPDENGDDNDRQHAHHEAYQHGIGLAHVELRKAQQFS